MRFLHCAAVAGFTSEYLLTWIWSCNGECPTDPAAVRAVFAIPAGGADEPLQPVGAGSVAIIRWDAAISDCRPRHEVR